MGRQVQAHSAQTDHRADGREEQRQEASSLAHQLAQESGRWNKATRWVEMFGGKIERRQVIGLSGCVDVR